MTKELTAKAGSIVLPVNHGYRYTYDWPDSTLKGHHQISLGDAVRTQIGKNGAGQAFPPYGGTGIAFLYGVSITSANASGFTLKGTLRLVITSAHGFHGKACSIAILYGTKWIGTGISAKPVGNRLVFALEASGSASLSKGRRRTTRSFAARGLRREPAAARKT